jgi:tetratricopeptide (TPR) repeat protein
MAGKSTLNAKNLEALGAARLAELLITLSQGNAAAKRVLRLALAEQWGPTEIAREVRKRLATISRSGSFLDGRQRDALLKDLDQQRRAIVGPIAEHEPALAVDLLWTFLELVEPVLERCDDSDGHVMPLFHQVTSDLGAVAARGKGNPEALADQVYGALIDNGYGQFDHLIEHLKEALGTVGLAHLRQRLEASRYRKPSDESRQITVRLAMLDIADALEDAEAYLAEYRDHDPGALSVPSFAADVAERLMAAGRADEALTLLDAADPRETNRSAGLEEWLDARIAALEMLDRGQEAQRLRWQHLERCLSIRHLRDYLQHLPDFEDAAEEERALGQVLDHPSFNRALRFLHQWPDRRRAAQLILRRLSELDGDCYELLGPVAESLEVEQPLAATLCLRAMIDFSLERARSTRYRHAARHLGTCLGLAPGIEDWGAMVDHRTYMARLRQEHGRKYGFWSLVSEVPELDDLSGNPGSAT